MLDIEIDGQKAQAPEGSMIIEAAERAGIYIPRFCYHKKLSVAANCRMCLVEVEKAPKPLPACATPVTNGMRVFTHSSLAVTAQKGVMEFLLINHPLDCPVCDQGGECQLQDIALGYGAASSRFAEEKHVAIPREAGPLVSMREMSRCIHCTRCVRFGQEIAGVMELGMTGRSLHSAITTFLGRAIESELSGNMIDLCPVGALTSKPFRYTARSWELASHRTISPHDSLGANLVAQTKNGRVARVLPHENEAVNECWITDRERFSYTALNSEERLTKPMLKQGGVWREVAWNDAIDYVAHGLKDIAQSAGTGTKAEATKSGVDSLAALVAPWATLEEMYLLKKLMTALGSENLDFRPRRRDFSADGKHSGTPWLGMKIADLRHLDSALIVGSFLDKDHPLMTQRLRHAAQKHHARISLIAVSGANPRLPLHVRQDVLPSRLAATLAAVLKAAARQKGIPIDDIAGIADVPLTPEAEAIADSLLTAETKAVFLGQAAEWNQDAGLLHALAARLAELTNASFGFLGEAANSVGGYLLGIGRSEGRSGGHSGQNSGNARHMFTEPRQGYLIFGLEPELDCGNPQTAVEALKNAKMTAIFTIFKHEAALEYADALLPLAPFTETSGTFVNAEGRVQSFRGAASPHGEARPGWKILRALGNALDLPDFTFESSEEVLRAAALPVTEEGFAAGVDNGLKDFPITLPASAAAGVSTKLERIADLPVYFTDPIVRRSAPLKETSGAAFPALYAASATLARLGLAPGDFARVRQSGGEAQLPAALDESVPEGAVRVAAGHAATARLGEMFDSIEVERL